jgi:hypothetical protein
MSTHQILCDLLDKNDLRDIKLIDGKDDQFEGYFIVGTVAQTNKRRLLVPWSAESVVDLEWYVRDYH